MSNISVTVISGLILACLTWLFKSYLKIAFLWVWKILVICLAWLFSFHQIHGWLIIVLIFTLVIVLAQSALRFRRSMKSDSGVYKIFREGYFEGFYWRWSYHYSSIIALRVFCPNRNCDMEVQLEYIGGSYSSRASTLLRCDRCGEKKSLGVEPQEIERIVTCEIERLIRTGQWKNNKEKTQA